MGPRFILKMISFMLIKSEAHDYGLNVASLDEWMGLSNGLLIQIHDGCVIQINPIPVRKEEVVVG